MVVGIALALPCAGFHPVLEPMTAGFYYALAAVRHVESARARKFFARL